MTARFLFDLKLAPELNLDLLGETSSVVFNIIIITIFYNIIIFAFHVFAPTVVCNNNNNNNICVQPRPFA